MKCAKARKKISVYVDGELHGEIKEKLVLHINDCVNCRKELENMQCLSSLNKLYEKLETSPRFIIELKNKVEKWEDRRISLIPFRFLKPVALCLSVVFVVFIAFLAGNSLTKAIWNEESAIYSELEEALGSSIIEDIQKESFSNIYDSLIMED